MKGADACKIYVHLRFIKTYLLIVGGVVNDVGHQYR